MQTKSAASLRSVKSNRSTKFPMEVPMLPVDTLLLKVFSLRISEEDPPYYAMKMAFGDNLLISAVVKPLGLKDKEETDNIVAKGSFTYDPSNYEKMCQFANQPLVVHIQPMTNTDASWQDFLHMNTPTATSTTPVSASTQSKGGGVPSGSGKSPLPVPPTPVVRKTTFKDVSRCNIDILPLFLGTEKLCIRKRLEPMVLQRPTQMKSWDNLPLLMFSIMAVRSSENKVHQEILNDANWLRITAIGMYNMAEPFSDTFSYIAVTKIPTAPPIGVDKQSELGIFSQGARAHWKFRYNDFYPEWETMKSSFEPFAKSDNVKLAFNLNEIFNPDELDLKTFLQNPRNMYSITWGSFHRTLLMGPMKKAFLNQQKRWKWPIEVYVYGDPTGTRSYMAFPDLVRLLYPGVNRVVVAVPLVWFNVTKMLEKSNCPSLTQPLAPAGTAMPAVRSKQTVTVSTGTPVEVEVISTGGYDLPAFMLLEVQLHRALVPAAIPPFIPRQKIDKMLFKMESQAPQEKKRQCVGRGQLVREWKSTVRTAAKCIQRVPYPGLTDLCNINRQLSETRTRVEILTSFSMDAAVYINNNFNPQEYLTSDEKFEELLMISHVSLMKTTSNILLGVDDWYSIDPALRAARHARQVNDVPHAMELYLQATVQNQYDNDTWRELSTCLKDVDKDWANVCLNKALLLETRHSLTLLSKGCMVFEVDPEGAEPFFDALLVLFPFWSVSNIVGVAYYTSREYFRLANEIQQSNDFILKDHLQKELPLPCVWGKELGDFWEPTTLLPGMSRYYAAADLLLRIRAIRMAELCLALALAESGETAAYCHLISLCYRLRGDYENALCIVRKAMQDFGENTSLLCMEGECLHQMEDQEGAMQAFTKSGGGTTAYSVLLSLPCWETQRIRPILVDLLRRLPSAYGWMALANDWLIRFQSLMSEEESVMSSEQQAALQCAEASAVQALKWDRRAGRAWALLAKLVHPDKRRNFCSRMALDCGFMDLEDADIFQLIRRTQESACHRIGVSIRECRCAMCILLSF